MIPPNGMDIEAAITVAASEIIMDSAAICITSGSSVTIRFSACNNPDTISLIDHTTRINVISIWIFTGRSDQSGKKVNSYHQRYFILMIGKRFLYMLRNERYHGPGYISNSIIS
jgi:hypothetical protein